MSANSINAGSITIMNSGNVLYSKSYGYQDAAKTVQVVTDPLMVTASIVKPLTAAAIQKLATAGTLNLSDRVFCTGSNQPCWLNVTNPGGTAISGTTGSGTNFKGTNYANITIQQLIDHEGGWDRAMTTCVGASNFTTINGVTNPTPCDPMIQEYLIQQTLRTLFPSNFTATQLPTQMNDIYYWVTQNSLDFVPGTRQAYSNFGYMLLSAIVSQASGSDFVTYAYNNLLKPLGVSVSDFIQFNFSPVANSTQALRMPAMQTSVPCISIYPANNGSYVSGTSQGCLNPVNWVGAATSMSTAKAMALLAGSYRIDNTSNLDASIHPSVDGFNNGKPLNGSTNSGVHYGDLPGVANIIRQLNSGTSYTLMLSKDSVPTGSWQQTLYTQIDAIISSANY
jgi:CubicO group peptidase (beta-lactamase class C family)